MIPTKSTIMVEGDVLGEEMAMTFDEASLPFLMKTFIDLYGDPALACVREYSTNAWDSHVAAGVTRPIEVSLPNGFSSFLTIEDFGLGMNKQDIDRTYRKFGASTKRNDNTQNGMLGLGSKAALTFTNAFNVTGIKDGIETHVAVTRSEEGGGTMEIISELPTDKPNGVKISIPMRSGFIDNTVKNFFRFWKPGTVLVNGKEPEQITGTPIGEFLFVPRLGQDFVVMGNVAYPVEQPYRIYEGAGGWNPDGVVAYVNMGDINFTPSREAIHMTPLSKNTLGELHAEFAKAADEHVKKLVENAPSHKEAARQYYELNSNSLRSYVSYAQYDGQTIPNRMSFTFSYSRHSNSVNEASYTSYRTLVDNDCLIVEDYPFPRVHSNHREKLRKWMDDNGCKADYIYFDEGAPDSVWLSHIPRVTWEDIKAIKLPKVVKIKDTNAVEIYDWLEKTGYKRFNTEVDTAKTTLIYASNAEIPSALSKEKATRYLMDDDTQFILVNKNRWKKLKQDHPHAKHFMDELKQRIADYQARLTDADKILLRADRQDRVICGKLDAAKIDDPELSVLVAALGTSDNIDLSLEKEYHLNLYTASHFEIPFLRVDGHETVNVFSNYPLMQAVHYRYVPEDHVYAYLNSAYREIVANNLKGENANNE